MDRVTCYYRVVAAQSQFGLQTSANVCSKPVDTGNCKSGPCVSVVYTWMLHVILQATTLKISRVLEGTRAAQHSKRRCQDKRHHPRCLAIHCQYIMITCFHTELKLSTMMYILQALVLHKADGGARNGECLSIAKHSYLGKMKMTREANCSQPERKARFSGTVRNTEHLRIQLSISNLEM